MAEAATKPGRLYKGVPNDERQAERRRKLIAGAIQVYGEQGFRNASVKAVCQAAGLTERYFYEAFTNGEDLLIATYDHVNQQLFDEIMRAGAAASRQRDKPRAMMASYFSALQAAPLEARLFLMDVRGVSPAVDAAISRWWDRFGALIAEVMRVQDADPILLRGVIGGLSHIAIAWKDIAPGAPPDRAVEQALLLCSGLPRATDDVGS